MLRAAFLHKPNSHSTFCPGTLHPSRASEPSHVSRGAEGAAGPAGPCMGVSTLYRAGQVEMTHDQLHAHSIHELERRQDLAQHPLAGAEGLQNLSKAWTAWNGSQHVKHCTEPSPAHPSPPSKQQHQPDSWGELGSREERKGWHCKKQPRVRPAGTRLLSPPASDQQGKASKNHTAPETAAVGLRGGISWEFCKYTASNRQPLGMAAFLLTQSTLRSSLHSGPYPASVYRTP